MFFERVVLYNQLIVAAAVYNVRVLSMCRWFSLHIHIPAATLHQGSVQVLCPRHSFFMVSNSGYFVDSLKFIFVIKDLA